MSSEETLNLQLRLKIRLENGTIGPGKIALLEHVEKEGSISAAGRALGVPFRRAWLLIETLNQALGRPVVQTTQGGRSGGGAKLTPLGARVVALYRGAQAQTDALRVELRESLARALDAPDS
ncbi:winged helix-turn-helix domain-containing protein [Varunaivibrio sulfuroxidans]|uniref:Molybdate transport system regulatory protein n=1 Tax=Varunaivibrio sulfuroxidans TaxID=1773489 RepID=A0A4R3JAK9_9PROT|nr:LysR family transcriptional regulator [Varunaivibrio sulfuroxidans]TCS62106.1 molybdate transport system regulatory protein [Varunaivibrio sulfuroxidans]WES30539.1 LysR family transcriptional regulator [Varunaivibrio sulfuroxidans]